MTLEMDLGYCYGVFSPCKTWSLLVRLQNHNHVSKLDWHAAYVPQLTDEEDLRDEDARCLPPAACCLARFSSRESRNRLCDGMMGWAGLGSDEMGWNEMVSQWNRMGQHGDGYGWMSPRADGQCAVSSSSSTTAGVGNRWPLAFRATKLWKFSLPGKGFSARSRFVLFAFCFSSSGRHISQMRRKFLHNYADTSRTSAGFRLRPHTQND